IAEDSNVEDLQAWAQAASERGLWHDWWLSGARDFAVAELLLEASELDEWESRDMASSRHHALQANHFDPSAVTITVDATWLGPHQTGAQVLTTAAIDALARNSRVAEIRLIGIRELPAYAQHLSKLDKVRIDAVDEAPNAPTDVIWYPNQIDQRVDISRARTHGRRVITTYLDMIAYDVPRYHASLEAWRAYRSLQRRTALGVDGVTTISADVAQRLTDEVPRLNPERIRPIPLGLDHINLEQVEPGEDIAALADTLTARPFLLVLGNDFRHKNRDFAIRVWEQVLADGTNCDLVLAGLHVKSSSSKVEENALLAEHANLRGTAHTVGHVSPQSREWLLSQAAVVLYPSSAEGFGFVPYEAAALGTPTTFTRFGPLAEISQVVDTPRAWTVDAYARDVTALLTIPERAHKRVNDLRAVISHSTWDVFAERLLVFMEHISQLPPAEAALVSGSAADTSALSAVLSSKTWRATEPLRRFGSRFRRS
ncbi:MAG: glycosyltransferase, partial [Gammaproteobacteria bacterium]|nr:glycosyltransferase [Gammaproteobacteria bacterium]